MHCECAAQCPGHRKCAEALAAILTITATVTGEIWPAAAHPGLPVRALLQRRGLWVEAPGRICEPFSGKAKAGWCRG